MKLDWDDLRYFLAVARHGSTKRAAAALKVDQTTCARRIGALEAGVGLQLFERGPSGYVLSEDGARLRPLIEQMDRLAEDVSTFAAQAARSRHAVIRLSVGDVLVEPVVHPALAEFRRKWPDVRVDLAVETKYADIMKGEADIAIRPGACPEEPDLVVRRLGGNPMGAYCTSAYIARHGMPSDISEFVERPFACMEGRALTLLSSFYPERPPRFVASTLQPLVEAVASGEFAALLPSLHADHLPGFVRCFPIEADTGSVWLVSNPRLRGQRHARDLLNALAKSFTRFAAKPMEAPMPVVTPAMDSGAGAG